MSDHGKDRLEVDNVEVHLLDVDDVSLSMQHFGLYDYIAFAFMLIVCALIGIYWGFVKKQNAQDYLIGSRNMRTFPVSLSLIASYISGITILGTPTEIYVYGTQYTYILIAVFFTCITTVNVYLPVFFELQLTSVYEYYEIRFNKKVRLFASVCFIFGLVTWLPIVIYVPALALNLVSGINVHVITPIVCLICIFYTSVGGLQAVVWTDAVQSFMMYGAILLVAIKGTIDVGGISTVFQRNWDSGRIEPPIWDPNPLVRHTFWSVVVGGYIHWLNGNSGNQLMVQRYNSLPNIAAVKRAVMYFAVGITVLLLTNFYCGLLTYATYHDCDPLTTKLAKAKDQLFPLLVMNVLKDLPGLPGIFVAGVFSASLSSLSTGLNSMSAVVLEDFYKSYSKNTLGEKGTQILLKSVVVIFGMLCVVLVILIEKMGTVLQLSMTLNSITAGALFGILTMGCMMPKVHANGALVGSVTSLVVMSWICLGTQMAIAGGDLTFAVKPTDTEGCNYSFKPSYTVETNSTYRSTNDDHSNVFVLYRLSYMWYALIGTIITIVVSLITSLLWKPVDPATIDPKLLSPFLRKYYRREEKSIAMQQISEKKTDEKSNSMPNEV